MDRLQIKQWRVVGLIGVVLGLLTAYAASPFGVVGMVLFGLNTLFGLFLLADVILSIVNTGWLGRAPGRGFYRRRAAVGAVGWTLFGLTAGLLSEIGRDEISLDGSEIVILIVMCGLFGAVTQALFVAIFASIAPRQKALFLAMWARLRFMWAWLRLR